MNVLINQVCKQCGDFMDQPMLDFDNFCFHCVLGLMVDGPGSPFYEEASGEYWQGELDKNALDHPPFWKTPIIKE